MPNPVVSVCKLNSPFRQGASHRRLALVLRRLLLLCPLLLVALAGVPRADDDDDDDVEEIDGGTGIMFRADHIEGRGIPQYRSITPIQAFPYLMMEDSLLFADLRFYPTNDFEFGGNAGFGYRYFSDPLDRIFGASVWYDGDNSRGFYFQQLGLSLETYAGPFDARANFYLPIGDTTRQTGLDVVPGSTRFTGNQLMYDQSRTWFSTMKGLDAEVGVPIPERFAADHGIRIYGGGYHFTPDEDGDDITGVSARLQGNIFVGLDAHVQITHDDFYDTRAFAGISWTFGALHRSQLRQNTAMGRIGEHVNRNYTVVAPERTRVESLVATNPVTGMAYSFAHVSAGAAPGGTGTMDSPFSDIATAANSGQSIVLVQSGTYNSPSTIALQSGQSLFGQGAGLSNSLAVEGLGQIFLPQTSGGAAPVLNGSAGNAILLANDTRVAGLTITNSAQSGILGNGVQNVDIRNVSVFNPGRSGYHLVNTGNVAVRNALVSNAGGPGIDIQGSNGPVQFLTTTSVFGPQGTGVSIHDMGATGSVTFENLTVGSRVGRGVAIDNVAGAIAFNGTTTIRNEVGSTASALDLRNSSGATTVNRLDVTGATGAPGVNLQNNTGSTTFGTLNVASFGGTAVRASNGGALIVNPADANGNINGTLGGFIDSRFGTALDLEGTFLNVNLTSVTATNATNGVRLVNNVGSVAVFGNGTNSSGGSLYANTVGVLMQNGGILGLRTVALDSNGTGIRTAGTGELYLDASSISNSTMFGVDALNLATFNSTNSYFAGNGVANIRGQFDKVMSSSYTLTQSQFNSAAANSVMFSQLAGGAGSTLHLVVDRSAFSSTAGGNAIGINWNGGLATTIDSSNFLLSGANVTAIQIQNTSLAGLTSVAINGNQIIHTGAAGTALRLVTAGSTQANITSNNIAFGGTNNTGMRFSLGASSNVNIASNDILDTFDGTTGILFDSLTGPVSVTLNDNAIKLTNAGGLLDQGIIFTNITNTATFASTVTNTVTGANTMFFAPVGTTSGTILINNVRLP